MSNAQVQIEPEFQVEKLEGTVEIERIKLTKRTVGGKQKLEKKVETVEVPAGYMVYLPSGASIAVRDEAELARLGFDRAPEMIDMQSGDRVGTLTLSLKQRAQARNAI